MLMKEHMGLLKEVQSELKSVLKLKFVETIHSAVLQPKVSWCCPYQ